MSTDNPGNYFDDQSFDDDENAVHGSLQRFMSMHCLKNLLTYLILPGPLPICWQMQIEAKIPPG